MSGLSHEGLVDCLRNTNSQVKLAVQKPTSRTKKLKKRRARNQRLKLRKTETSGSADESDQDESSQLPSTFIDESQAFDESQSNKCPVDQQSDVFQQTESGNEPDAQPVNSTQMSAAVYPHSSSEERQHPPNSQKIALDPPGRLNSTTGQIFSIHIQRENGALGLFVCGGSDTGMGGIFVERTVRDTPVQRSSLRVSHRLLSVNGISLLVRSVFISLRVHQ